MKTVLFKVGGSLLTLGDLASRLQMAFSQRSECRILIVVGGGSTADIVREWDRIHQLGDERAHWLAIRSLQLNEALLAEIIPEAEVVGTREAVEAAWTVGRIPIICVFEFMKQEEEVADSKLPHCWDVTSDSIAAWIAGRWPVDELVLLKSSDLPTGYGSDRAARDKLVDSHFPSIATGVKLISWANLRADQPEIETWLEQRC